MRKLTLYRDDSTVQVVFENVKHFFWTAGNTVLVVAQITDDSTGAHQYIHWPRERFCWFKDSGGSLNKSLEGEVLADFGKLVKDRRKQLKLSSTEVADLSGLSTGSISDIERGANTTLSSANKLAEALGIVIRGGVL